MAHGGCGGDGEGYSEVGDIRWLMVVGSGLTDGGGHMQR